MNKMKITNVPAVNWWARYKKDNAEYPYWYERIISYVTVHKYDEALVGHINSIADEMNTICGWIHHTTGISASVEGPVECEEELEFDGYVYSEKDLSKEYGKIE